MLPLSYRSPSIANHLSSISPSQRDVEALPSLCYAGRTPQPNFLSQSEYAGLEEILDTQHDEKRIIRCLNSADLFGHMMNYSAWAV